MTIEQMRERILIKINERFNLIKDGKDLVDVWEGFIKYKTTIELALSLGLIDMGEYLNFDKDGDHLYHDKHEEVKDKPIE